jgi:hypothetical protein
MTSASHLFGPAELKRFAGAVKYFLLEFSVDNGCTPQNVLARESFYRSIIDLIKR